MVSISDEKERGVLLCGSARAAVGSERKNKLHAHPASTSRFPASRIARQLDAPVSHEHGREIPPSIRKARISPNEQGEGPRVKQGTGVGQLKLAQELENGKAGKSIVMFCALDGQRRCRLAGGA